MQTQSTSILAALGHMRRWLVRAALACLLIAGPIKSLSAADTAPVASYYVASTGHALSDPFLSFWVENDGANALGNPVSDPVERKDRETQYFEYGALVVKSNGDVKRLRSGTALLQGLSSKAADQSNAGTATEGTPSAEASKTFEFPLPPDATGTLTVDPAFQSAWEKWGGEDGLGDPISVAYAHGQTTTQWFEYGRLDLKAGDVTRGKIGANLAKFDGVDTAAADQGALPLFDPARFSIFSGDGSIPNATTPFDPVRLQIPALQIDAAIEITTVQDGAMTVPQDPWNVGWYELFSLPGQWTNTVLAGHRDWWGYGPVVFYNLGALQVGDKIYLLAADGTGATYVVESNTLVPNDVDASTVIGDTGYEALTLITCGGSFDGSEYDSRVIIRAKRI